MPDTYNMVSGPISIAGTQVGNYFYHQFTKAEELLLEPGQILGFGGAQIGYR